MLLGHQVCCELSELGLLCCLSGCADLAQSIERKVRSFVDLGRVGASFCRPAMKLFSVFLCFVCLCPAPAQPAELTQAGVELPLVLGQGEQAWAELFEAIAKQTAVFSSFKEQRWFGFKKTPVELTGQLRFTTEAGLSLLYLGEAGADRMVILDGQGVLLRDGKGREKKAPDDAKVSGLVRSILAVMRMDLAALRENFQVLGARAGEAWRLDFVPVSRDKEKVFGSIQVFGNNKAVKHLVFKRGGNSRIEIFILESHAVDTFSEQARAQYFR